MTQNTSIGPGSLFVIAAPSGAGKTTLTRMALAQNPRLALSISTTTRAPRPGEENGVHYHFVTDDRFDELMAEGGLLEWAVVHGSARYGTPRQPVEGAVAASGRRSSGDLTDVPTEARTWRGARSIAAHPVSAERGARP